MIKILTATGNKNLNNILKKEKEFEIVENDIFYKEGILEFLEKNNKIDIIILYEKLNGEINIINLIKNIKKINNKINIFFILENKNMELENLLKEENIENIFYNDEINIEEFINKIKNIKINMEENLNEEIKKLKNINKEKNEEKLKYKKTNINEKNKKEKTNKINRKIINVIGEGNIGKTTIINNIKIIINTIKKENNFIFNEININNLNEIKKLNNNYYKTIFILESNFENIKTNKKIINNLILKNKINIEKIYFIFNKLDKYSINKKIIKNIFKKYKIIGFIKFNNYNNFLNNKKNNLKYENIKIKKEYLKIINKL